MTAISTQTPTDTSGTGSASDTTTTYQDVKNAAQQASSSTTGSASSGTADAAPPATTTTSTTATEGESSSSTAQLTTTTATETDGTADDYNQTKNTAQQNSSWDTSYQDPSLDFSKYLPKAGGNAEAQDLDQAALLVRQVLAEDLDEPAQEQKLRSQDTQTEQKNSQKQATTKQAIFSLEVRRSFAKKVLKEMGLLKKALKGKMSKKFEQKVAQIYADAFNATKKMAAKSFRGNSFKHNARNPLKDFHKMTGESRHTTHRSKAKADTPKKGDSLTRLGTAKTVGPNPAKANGSANGSKPKTSNPVTPETHKKTPEKTKQQGDKLQARAEAGQIEDHIPEATDQEVFQAWVGYYAVKEQKDPEEAKRLAELQMQRMAASALATKDDDKERNLCSIFAGSPEIPQGASDQEIQTVQEHFRRDAREQTDQLLGGYAYQRSTTTFALSRTTATSADAPVLTGSREERDQSFAEMMQYQQAPITADLDTPEGRADVHPRYRTTTPYDLIASLGRNGQQTTSNFTTKQTGPLTLKERVC